MSLLRILVFGKGGHFILVYWIRLLLAGRGLWPRHGLLTLAYGVFFLLLSLIYLGLLRTLPRIAARNWIHHGLHFFPKATN